MAQINLNVGRQRRTSAVSPSSAGYIASINKQMAAIRKNLEKVISAVQLTNAKALEYALKPMFDTSQILVPVDTGKLKRSGKLEARQLVGKATATLSYGAGGNPFYAPIVHERFDLNHTAPTQAKYLEEAVNRHVNEVIPRYNEFIRRTTGLS